MFVFMLCAKFYNVLVSSFCLIFYVFVLSPSSSSSLLIFFRFINARRRIVQPMIDQSNRAGKSPIVTVFKSRSRKPSTLHALGGLSAGKYRTDPLNLGMSKTSRGCPLRYINVTTLTTTINQLCCAIWGEKVFINYKI